MDEHIIRLCCERRFVTGPILETLIFVVRVSSLSMYVARQFGNVEKMGSSTRRQKVTPTLSPSGSDQSTD